MHDVTVIDWEGQLPWAMERKNLGFSFSTFRVHFGKVVHSDGVTLCFFHLQNKVAAEVLPLVPRGSGGSKTEMPGKRGQFSSAGAC